MYIEKLHVVYFHLFGGDVFLTFLYMYDSHIRYEIHASHITLPFLLFKKRHFQQYFSFIVMVSFIGEGNWNTLIKPPTCHKSLTNFIT